MCSQKLIYNLVNNDKAEIPIENYTEPTNRKINSENVDGKKYSFTML